MSVAWIPFEDMNCDRFHMFYFKCHLCQPLAMACQFFGHDNPEVTCDRYQGNMVMDKPVCSSDTCEERDFMIPSHYLIQKFIDPELNQFLVFFQDPSEVDNFFGDLSAKRCLEESESWCKLQSVRLWHKNRFECFIPRFFDIVLFEQLEPSKRFYFVSGKLPQLDC